MTTEPREDRTIRIDKKVHRRLRIKAAEEDKTMTEVIESLLPKEDK